MAGPNIRDVARRAGVSTATVARVLRGGTTVSPELTERVRAAVAELNYVPNAVARSLSRGRTGLLGLLVADIANPFYGEVARGLEDVAAGHGYQVLVGSSDLRPERERRVLASLESRTVDGVALTSTATDPRQLWRLRDAGMPLVFIDRRPTGVPGPAVVTDNAAAAQRAVRHLTELGHTDLAMISGPTTMQTAAQRVEGFRKACLQEGLDVRAECVLEGYLGTEGGRDATRAVLAARPRPTALLSFNNLLAVGALGALRAARVRVPDEMSLLTFDDMLLFPYVEPPITAIAQPAYEMGAAAGRLLLQEMGVIPGGEGDPAGDDVATELVLPTELRVRASCAPPAGRPAAG